MFLLPSVTFLSLLALAIGIFPGLGLLLRLANMGQ